jgi:hypothetical protein
MLPPGSSWHATVVRLEGTTLMSTVSIDGQPYPSEAVNTEPTGGELRFGAWFCDPNATTLTYAFDDIVLRDL